MAEQYFHLTLGPVQAFVAQARRTRDFWAGSFILSYLSSVAMAAVRQQQGEIQFPVPDNNYFRWLENNAPQGAAPVQGSVPNRFKALGAKVGEHFEPQAVVDAIGQAWRELAELVWRYDVLPVVGEKSEQRKIWQRQIEGFWEISWCLTEEAEASSLLDRRKNWRSHLQADEAGVKCSLMEGYQELSGEQRPSDGVKTFWNSIREQDQRLARDLREDEHLCAIALVKRRFVHYFAELEFTLPAVQRYLEKKLYGWTVPTSVPSVAYLAAAPWLAASIGLTRTQPVLLESIDHLQRALKELDVPWEGGALRLVREATKQARLKGWSWQQVNGQYLFPAALQQNIKDAERNSSLTRFELAYLRRAQDHLQDIRRESGLGEPSPFYAVLLMDGDSLGIQMSNPAKQQGISCGLNSFTSGVPEIISQYSGFLVYAGGDDVLALLPQPFAVECAQKVQQLYDYCFAEINKTQGKEPIFTSISGAIEFAHYKTPLTRILQDSHDLLDNVAKEKTGRNSLAIRLWRPGGLNAQWSAPWSRVDALIEASQQVGQHLQGDLSRSFFFKLEDIIQQLGLTKGQHGFDAATVQSLVRAAWTHTGNKLDSLPQNMDLNLLKACQQVVRETDKETAKETASDQFVPGALRLLQFLATENQRFLNPAVAQLQEEAQ